MLMDTEECDWMSLQKQTEDREGWRAKVNVLKTAARRKTAPPKPTKTSSNRLASNYSASYNQIHFQAPLLKNKIKKNDKKKKVKSNVMSRKLFYGKIKKRWTTTK